MGIVVSGGRLMSRMYAKGGCSNPGEEIAAQTGRVLEGDSSTEASISS